MNTLEPALMKYRRLAFSMCLLTCYMGAVSTSFRAMWVSTTGEDSPRCVHAFDSMERDPSQFLRHNNGWCRSLNYALKHIQNETFIGISCGVHVLEPDLSWLHKTALLNVTSLGIMGACGFQIMPKIQCNNGANLPFYNVADVIIQGLEFHGCGDQLQPSNSLLISSTLYFQDCQKVTIVSVDIFVTGPYGRGISVIRNDTTVTHGAITVAYVMVIHYGIHGSGLHFEVLTGKTTDISLEVERIQLQDIFVRPSYDHTKEFTGINITLTGEGGDGEISLSNVLIQGIIGGSGISITLLDSVHNFTIQLSRLLVEEDRMENHVHHFNENMTESGITIVERLAHIFENTTLNNCTTHSSIKIELKGNSTGNRIKLHIVTVFALSPFGGSALSIELANHCKENVILLQGIRLQGSNGTFAHKRGLKVVITGWARGNKIQVTDLRCWWLRAFYGAGVYIEFSGHAMGNRMKMQNNSIAHNGAYRGGGIAIVCKDHAAQNTITVFKNISVFNNFAEVGGGFHLILKDFSNNNTIHLRASIMNNTAHCGGGMYIRTQNATIASTVIIHSDFVNNTLLSSTKYSMMGGGVHVEFSTVSATFKTNNTVSFTECSFALNMARHGIGGGISVLYKQSRYQGESGDTVIVDSTALFQNRAVSGSACAFQSIPTHEKRLFRGIRIQNVRAYLTMQPVSDAELLPLIYNHHNDYVLISSEESIALIRELPQTISTFFQVETNTNLILAKSVQLTVAKLEIFCGASSQGIFALNSEIALQENYVTEIRFCVASHGGAIALHGESYIRVARNVTIEFLFNHAFQRGGAIYAGSATGIVPASNCFVQNDPEWDSVDFYFFRNSAKAEGQSIYVADVRNCFPGGLPKDFTTILDKVLDMEEYAVSTNFVGQVNLKFYYNRNETPTVVSTILKSRKLRREAIKREIVSGPRHAGGDIVDLNKPLTVCFIPGKPKQLPYTNTSDKFGSAISTVFMVTINMMKDSTPVELNPFSKFTADFTIILHGIPQQHGIANHSIGFPTNTSNTYAVDTPPQLVLQSIDNNDLLLVMNIEIQCCPAGYIYRYDSGDMETCHCGMFTLSGIAECNESNPKVIGAVLERDHWAGYLPSNDQSSCNGQKFFIGHCPPGYCQTQQVTLPDNNSKHALQETMCRGSNRKGLLCGECIEGSGIAVNFNGIRPVCVNCEEGLSNVGVFVWILSEWFPMLAIMFVFMLFNIDLISGRFNSFLLFAQLLAFSTIRGDVDLGPVHNAFVRIYRFLYGIWNLDFFGVLLPQYCLTPNAHLTLLQTLFLHYLIGLFPLIVAITITILERSAEKWICCHRLDQFLRRMRQWKMKYSDGMSYDRALPAFVILGFTRFLVSSTYIIVNQTITGEDGEGRVVVWWQGSVPYGSIQHIAYFIPVFAILLVFVLLPTILLLTLPIVPQLFGRLLIAVPPLRRLQKMQTFCSNVYTDRWVYHFVNVFQGCYKECYRSFSSLYLLHRIVHLLVAVFINRVEDALRIQIIFIVALLLLITTCQPYISHQLNVVDAAILGNLSLILILSLYITDLNSPISARQFYASIQIILIYLALLYPGILLGKKMYLMCRQLRCCHKQDEPNEALVEPLLEAPAERLGAFALITELHAGMPTTEDDDYATETETET